MHKKGTRRALVGCLLGILIGTLGLGALALIGGAPLTEGLTPRLFLLIGFATITLTALWVALTLGHEHFDALERLRGRVLMLRDDDAAPLTAAEDRADEVGRLAAAMGTAVGRLRERLHAPDLHLSAIIGALDTGLVVITEQGLVSLVNGPALALLGPEHAATGTSIFASLDDRSLARAMAAARGRDDAVEATVEAVDGQRLRAKLADLGDHRGFLLSFPEAGGPRHRVHHDLSLHDRPPPIVRCGEATRLDALPVWVLDTETTGLDVAKDRIVSIGGIRLHGPRLYRAVTIDRLVNPGRPIPPLAVGVHGIGDETVAAAPAFAEIAAELRDLLGEAVVVGHNVGFDIALLRAAFAEAGVEWPEPPTLDTLQLVAALEPGRTDLDLEHIAEACGIPVTGRHTALGDCLVTANLFARLIPRLAAHGIETFGQAKAFALSAKRVVARQRAAGW